MADEAASIEILSLSEFPPVTAAEWDAAIRTELKGADYEKKVVWRTEEGLAVRPYYRAGDVPFAAGEPAPGEFPFVRGTGEPWVAAGEMEIPADAVRADVWHEAGAHAVQELAWAMAAGIERLAGRAAGQTVDEAARNLAFVFAVGPEYFVEIAKFRAARLLWARVVEAFGPEREEAAQMQLYVRTARRNKSVYDPYSNLLRATTEALSAVIGGCDRLQVEAFGFEPHLAESVHHILREEAHMDEVADPAGGSYYIEAMTDALGRAAWKLLQQVEGAGGYGAAVQAGALEKALAETRAARQKAVALRRRTLVGVNNYPDLHEKTAAADTPDGAGRLAEPFERIRERTARHAAQAGRSPKLLLLERGDVKMRGARANFMLNFFGCAGFDIDQSSEYAGSGADLIALCSSDAEYLALAREVCPTARVPVIVAGNPQEQAEELRAAGVAGFVHMGSDAVATLTEWQNRLGIGE